MGKRRNFGAEFKARVATEAIEGALTMAQLATPCYGSRQRLGRDAQ